MVDLLREDYLRIRLVDSPRGSCLANSIADLRGELYFHLWIAVPLRGRHR